MIRVLRFLKLARILRVGKIGVFMEAFEQELVGSSWSMLLFAISKIIIFLMFVAHIGGCFWYMVGVSNQDKYGASWLTEKMPEYNIEEWFVRSTNYLWSVHFAMATMTTVGYGDISPTNTAELVYGLGLLWLSMIVFSASLGILMNLITGIYEEGQERRNKLADLAKYMSWRVLPYEMRGSLRRYLNFVWEISTSIGEVEEQVMEKLSPTLKSKLCVHIFGDVLKKCQFLTWMHDDPEAMKKLCLRVKSEFLEANDMLFSFGEMNITVFILVNGWVTRELYI